MTDDELWHVRMSHDDVKQLTLEQLDDLFRLEVIEADTLIWQPGMTEWLPLSVVAGLGDEDPEPMNIPVSEPPTHRVVATQTSWPPDARLLPPSVAPPPSMRSAPPARSVPPAPVAQNSWPPPAAWSNPPPRPTPAPAPAAWSSAPKRPVSVSPYASTVQGAPPLPSRPPASVAPVSFAPEPFPRSVAPAAFTTAPVLRAPRRSSGGGSWMVLLAFAAGAAVTLYRNDLVHAAARSVGQEGAYLKLETALGGPSFGTPRAVQQMAAAAAALTSTADVASPSGVMSSATATTAAALAATTTTTPAPSPSSATTAPSDATAHAADAAPNPTHTEASAPVKAAAPVRSPAPAVAQHAVSHASASSPEKDIDPVFKTPKKGKKSKGSEYDPLNGSL